MNYLLGCEYKQRSCTCRGLNGKGVVDKILVIIEVLQVMSILRILGYFAG